MKRQLLITPIVIIFIFTSPFCLKAGEKESSGNHRLAGLFNNPPTLFNPYVARPTSNFFLNTRYGESSLQNQEINLDNNYNDAKKSFHIEAGYQRRLFSSKTGSSNPHPLSRLFSYGVGIGFSRYSSEIGWNINTLENITGKDLEGVTPNDDVIRTYYFFDVHETTDIKFIHFPLFIEFGNPNIDGLGFFLRLGSNIAIKVSDDFTGVGKHTVSGYYEDYDVLIENVKELGFYKEGEMYNPEADKYKLNNLQFLGTLSAGLSYNLGGRWILNAGGQYYFGITDILESGDKPEEELIKMFFKNGNKTSLRHLGFQIGMQYVIGDIF